MLLNINRFLRNSIARSLCVKYHSSTCSATSVQVTRTSVPLFIVRAPEEQSGCALESVKHNYSINSTSPRFPSISELIVQSSPRGKMSILDFPLASKNIIHCPTNSSVGKLDITPEHGIEAPPTSETHEKHAARLIVIRRRKMKKHKLKKLRKKMKFEWGKVRQRREMRKEKIFQAKLIAQIKEGEKFHAAQYVAEKLRLAQEVKLPRTWKGKRLPAFIIKQKLGIKD